MKKKRQVLLELLPNRLDVVVQVGSQRIAGRRIPISTGREPEEWIGHIQQAAGPLREAVTELGAEGLPTTVVYRSPTSAMDLASLPVKPAEARQAAELSCFDAVSFPADSAVCRSLVVRRDATGETPRNHVIVAVERDDVAQAVAGLVEVAGLHFDAAAPIDAALMAHLVSEMLQACKPLEGRLYVGEHSSFFLVAAKGSLVFARRISIGLDTIANSLTRPIQRGAGAEPVQLDAAAARQILHDHGRPQRDQTVHEKLGLRGGDLLPLMQPVLQRLVIELRQSVRFGLTPEHRENLELALAGPGGGLPGLAELLSEELDVTVAGDAKASEHRWDTPGGPCSELADLLGAGRIVGRLSLQPRALSIERNTTRLRRWLWTGAAAALAVIAIDAGRYHLRVGDLEEEAQALQTQVSGHEALQATTQRLGRVVQAMRTLQRRIDREMGTRSNYRSILLEITRITPESMRLTSLSLSDLEGRTSGMVTGFAFNDLAEDGRADVEPFIQQMRRSPIFEEVRLGNVQMGNVAEMSGQNFTVSFGVVPAPRDTDALVAVPPEVAP